ncbi:MAG: gluconate 2-dehydrogenase subunit 3 family protein [Acidobacteriaceae bacterium]
MNRKRSFPTKPKSGEPIRDLEQPGYYPGYSTLGQQKKWDETTRDVVVKRVDRQPEIRFFQPAEAELLAAIIDRVIPQDDRADNRTILILPIIDERLYKNELNGFRYGDMPPDRDAYHLGLKAINEMAEARFQQPFTELAVYRQELLLKSLHDGKPDPDHPVWKQMPVHRFWALLMEDCVTAYYSHPWSWDEIGFGGPAYPRAYMRLENGLPEPWEEDETRYEWNAPADSISEIDLEGAPPGHGSLHGHGGTH